MGKIENLKSMLSEKRLGFKIDEVMSGEHEFVGDAGPPGKLPMEFCVTWGPEHLSNWANPIGENFMSQPLKGEVRIGGLCKSAPCQGTLELRYFSEAKIRYNFDFTVGIKKYHFVGEKTDIRPWNLHKTHTTCYGTLTEVGTGEVISKSITYFRFSTLPSFLASFRLA